MYCAECGSPRVKVRSSGLQEEYHCPRCGAIWYKSDNGFVTTRKGNISGRRRTKVLVALIVVALFLFFGPYLYNGVISLLEQSHIGSEQIVHGDPTQESIHVDDLQNADGLSPVARYHRLSALPSWCMDALELGGDYFDNLRDDDSGYIRELRIYQTAEIPYYALSYYLHYFANDNEIHFIVDASGTDTWRLRVVDGKLAVDRFEATPGEDQNAALLGSGELLGSYEVDLNAGSVLQTYGDRYVIETPSSNADSVGASIDDGEKHIYIGNINTGVFHKNGCLDAERMDQENKVLIYDTRTSMIDRGYVPCGHCKP